MYSSENALPCYNKLNCLASPTSICAALSTAARVASAELTRLRQALPAAGWHDLTAEDGTVALDLSKVVYVLVDHEEHRVGFGT